MVMIQFCNSARMIFIFNSCQQFTAIEPNDSVAIWVGCSTRNLWLAKSCCCS